MLLFLIIAQARTKQGEGEVFPFPFLKTETKCPNLQKEVPWLVKKVCCLGASMA